MTARMRSRTGLAPLLARDAVAEQRGDNQRGLALGGEARIMHNPRVVDGHVAAARELDERLEADGHRDRDRVGVVVVDTKAVAGEAAQRHRGI